MTPSEYETARRALRMQRLFGAVDVDDALQTAALEWWQLAERPRDTVAWLVYRARQRAATALARQQMRHRLDLQALRAGPQTSTLDSTPVGVWWALRALKRAGRLHMVGRLSEAHRGAGSTLRARRARAAAAIRAALEGGAP